MCIEYDGKEYWQGLLDRDNKPMDESTTMMLMQCIMMEKDGFKRGIDEEMDKNLEQSMALKVFEKRLEAAGVECTLPLAMFLTSMCDNPAKVVMWAYTVNLIRVADGLSGPVTIEDMTRHFAWGFPLDSEYSKIWDEQKKEGQPLGNMVDNFENWPGVVV